jgi:ATP-dependent HslUV protease ATP-binding subunit HslU
MVRDLVELGVDMVREERRAEVREKAAQAAEERILDLLLPPLPPPRNTTPGASTCGSRRSGPGEAARAAARRPLDHKHVEIDVREKSFPSFEIIAGSSVEEVDINVKDMLPGLFQGRSKKRKLRLPEAREALARKRSRS